MSKYYIEHQKIFVSVDCIIFGFEDNQLKILIGRRQMDPGCGEWSLSGGFVRYDESVSDAAYRVLNQLTGINQLFMRQVGAFGNIDRDPGERVISIAYCALINVKDYDKKLMEEHHMEWVTLNDLPPMYSDHRQMIEQALQMMREKIKTEPISFRLLPKLFTLTQLQKLYEAVNGEEVDKRNFRKRIKDMDFIEKTQLIDKSSSKRGAALYRFNTKAYNEEQKFKL